jgi:AcrR family transcriptional regulator
MAKTKNPELEQQRKALIIDTVARLLSEGSHRQLTLERVAHEAGISKGMVTYYFSSKDQLILQTIHHFLDRQGRRLMAIASSELPIRERLQELLATALPDRETLERDVRFQAEVLSFAKDVPEAYEAVRRSYVAFRQACEALVVMGIEEGYVTAPDARWTYVLLHSLLDGLAVQITMDPDLDADEARRRALALVDELLTAPGTAPATASDSAVESGEDVG